MSIKIYEAESAIAGLSEKILANASVTFASKLTPATDHNKTLIAIANRNADTVESSEGLYATESIFVTTNWNKNDDVFTPQAVWAARKTPVNKQTNLGHSEHKITGHITNTWAIDTDGNAIAEDTEIEDLPDTFHLCNGAVIYTAWNDEELQARADTLVEEIEAGDKFVSMECMFTNFNYAVVDPDGKQYIVARNKDTAYLTKHLKVYGGEGTFEGYKLGRVLGGNMNFSGKGYVDAPANPDSIIFDKTSANDTSFTFSDSINQNPFVGDSGDDKDEQCVAADNELLYKETTSMSDAANERLQSQNDELAKTVAQLQEQLSKAGLEKFETEITELKAAVASNEASAIEDAEKLEKAEASITELKEQLLEATKAKDEAATALAAIEGEISTAKRVNVLVAGGFTQEDAQAKVEIFNNLTDEQFETIATTLVEAKTVKPEEATAEETEEESPETDSADAGATDEALDTAQVSIDAEAAAAAASGEQEEKEAPHVALARIIEKSYETDK